MVFCSGVRESGFEDHIYAADHSHADDERDGGYEPNYCSLFKWVGSFSFHFKNLLAEFKASEETAQGDS